MVVGTVYRVPPAYAPGRVFQPCYLLDGSNNERTSYNASDIRFPNWLLGRISYCYCTRYNYSSMYVDRFTA